MKPQSPVLLKPISPLPEITLAKDQPEYQPLPVMISRDACGTVTSRWKLTWHERVRVLLSGNIWVQQLCFHNPVTPLLPRAEEPEIHECL